MKAIVRSISDPGLGSKRLGCEEKDGLSSGGAAICPLVQSRGEQSEARRGSQLDQFKPLSGPIAFLTGRGRGWATPDTYIPNPSIPARARTDRYSLTTFDFGCTRGIA